jgi:hypothetical protein
VNPPEFDPRQAACAALNEQGFLFAHLIREKVSNNIRDDVDGQNDWVCVASEYPVTATDGSQTRIDIVLRRAQTSLGQRNIHLCLECKRFYPKYSRWLFFERTAQSPEMPPAFFLESLRFSHENDTHHLIFSRAIDRLNAPKDFPVFNCYVECLDKVRVGEASSSTERIEKALQQVVRGSTGLIQKMYGYRADHKFYRSIPVLVTTANLFEAKYDHNKITLDTGQLTPTDVELQPWEYCAVNYHADDSLSVPVEGRGFAKTGVADDLLTFQLRTVFVVRSTAVNKFLQWAAHSLTQGF